MTTVRRSEIIDVLEWMATPSLLHLWMNETTHLLSMQIYRRSWIDTRSSIDFFCYAKFVDRDDWSNNSAVFLVWNAIILRHLKERDAWIFRNAIIIRDKLIMTVYVGGIVTVQVSLTQWRYIHHFSLIFLFGFLSLELIFKVPLNGAYPCGSYIPQSHLPSIFFIRGKLLNLQLK